MVDEAAVVMGRSSTSTNTVMWRSRVALCLSMGFGEDCVRFYGIEKRTF